MSENLATLWRQKGYQVKQFYPGGVFIGTTAFARTRDDKNGRTVTPVMDSRRFYACVKKQDYFGFASRWQYLIFVEVSKLARDGGCSERVR